MRQRVMIAMALDQRPGADHRRRADDRARRHDPGADPRAHQAAAGRLRVGRDHDHPRPRRRRGDGGRRRSSCTRAQDRRARPGARDLQRAAAPVHVGPDGIAAAARHQRRAARTRSRASRRRCSTRRRAAGSTRAARTRCPSAASESRCSPVAAHDPTHEQACHLDEETKAREAARSCPHRHGGSQR